MNLPISTLIAILAVVIWLFALTLSGCGDDVSHEDKVYKVEIQLPKIDCNEHLNRTYFDVAGRGLDPTSGAGKSVIDDAREWCAAENKRRGY